MSRAGSLGFWDSHKALGSGQFVRAKIEVQLLGSTTYNTGRVFGEAQRLLTPFNVGCAQSSAGDAALGKSRNSCEQHSREGRNGEVHCVDAA